MYYPCKEVGKQEDHVRLFRSRYPRRRIQGYTRRSIFPNPLPQCALFSHQCLVLALTHKISNYDDVRGLWNEILYFPCSRHPFSAETVGHCLHRCPDGGINQRYIKKGKNRIRPSLCCLIHCDNSCAKNSQPRDQQSQARSHL